MSKIRLVLLFVFPLFVSAAFAAGPAKKPAPLNQYTCKDDICSCNGDADCNDMFTNAGCGDLAYCTTNRDGRVFCECLKRQGQTSKSRGSAFPVTAVDLKSGKATVKEAKSGARASIPVSAALLSHVKVGDTLYVIESSTLLTELQAARAGKKVPKKTPEECNKCRSDCFDGVKGKFHLVLTKKGTYAGDKGWEDAMRSCLSSNGCTGQDCAE
jgi:hypothetical protein